MTMGGTDCRSRLDGFAMTRKEENGLPQPFTRLRNDKKLVILNAKREKIRNTIRGLS